MKPIYERQNLIITEFDVEDVITTSGLTPTDPTTPETKVVERENSYRSFRSFEGHDSWF